MDDGSRPPMNRHSQQSRNPYDGYNAPRRTSRRVSVDAESDLHPFYARAKEVRESNRRKESGDSQGTLRGGRVRVHHDEPGLGFVDSEAKPVNRGDFDGSRQATKPLSWTNRDTVRPSSRDESRYSRMDSLYARKASSDRRPDDQDPAGYQRQTRPSARGQYGQDPYAEGQGSRRERRPEPSARADSPRAASRRPNAASRMSTPPIASTGGPRSAYRTSIEYETEPSQRYSHPMAQLDGPLNPSSIRSQNPRPSRSQRSDQRGSRISMGPQPRTQDSPGILEMLLTPRTAIIAGIIIVAIVLIMGVSSCISCIGGENEPAPTANPTDAFSAKLADAQETADENGIIHGTTTGGIDYTVQGRGVAGLTEGKVTLAAVGDSLAADGALEMADSYAGRMGDDKYDFKPYYKEVKPFLANYDLKFINQETILHASSSWKAAGYPTFNSPASMVDAIDDAGFNMVSFCSNHIYDHWTDGITASHEVFNQHPNLMVAGSYESKKDRNTIQLMERNGITFALLAYGYGANGYKNSDLPNNYYLTTFSKKTLKADVTKAKKVADVVIVYMHWGTEYTSAPDATQKKYAQYLADLDVDLVLGSHAHCTQPIKYYKGKNGNKTPVVFGMSDFISGYTKIDTILSGVFTCDFIKGEDKITVENLTWYPCIEWSDGKQTYVRMIKDMTEEEINANKQIEDCDDIYQHIVDFEEGLKSAASIVMKNPDEGSAS